MWAVRAPRGERLRSLRRRARGMRGPRIGDLSAPRTVRRGIRDAAREDNLEIKETDMSAALSPGTRAPEFVLRSTPDQVVTLAELRDRPLVLTFYPADWSPVCGDQLALYNELLPELERLGARIAGVSVDGAWCHAAFARDRKLHFPLLADFEPKGAVARAYGVYRDQDGVAERALFVIDPAGVIRWSYVSPLGVNPGADGFLAALEELAPPQAVAR
jgi:peroxiredoxin